MFVEWYLDRATTKLGVLVSQLLKTILRFSKNKIKSKLCIYASYMMTSDF